MPPAAGKKRNVDPGMQALRKYERDHLSKLTNSAKKTAKDWDQWTKKTERALKKFNAEAEKHLVALDALPIITGRTPDSQKARNRTKRKKLVNALQDVLKQNDKLLRGLEALKAER
ncbi:hypothetical protein M3Y99_00718700 [Aphelenchoides fujianensis]|nr:hypothetical protein M3Y99_00718700 [Aphelenchoides fujianensis]